MIKTKNKKIKLGTNKYKIPEQVYNYIYSLESNLQRHEIAMIGWVKNCYMSDDKEYKEEFNTFVMSLPHAEETIKRMIELDEKLEKENTEKEEESKE